MQAKLAGHPQHDRCGHNIVPLIVQHELDQHRGKQHVDDVLRQDVHEGRLVQEGRDRGETQRIVEGRVAQPVEPDRISARQHHLRHHDRDHNAHRITIKLERAAIDRRTTSRISGLHHLAGINHADHQAGQEYETLSVFHEGELVVIDFYKQVSTSKDKVVEYHENEEVPSHSVNDFKALHRSRSPSLPVPMVPAPRSVRPLRARKSRA
ncbi:hypothetical protein D3C73_639730 [compost metagenome]